MDSPVFPPKPTVDPAIRRLEEVAEWLHRQDLGMIDPATIFVAQVDPES